MENIQQPTFNIEQPTSNAAVRGIAARRGFFGVI